MKYLLVTLSPSLPPRSRKQQHPPSNSSSSCCSQDSLHPASQRASRREERSNPIRTNPRRLPPSSLRLAKRRVAFSSIRLDSLPVLCVRSEEGFESIPLPPLTVFAFAAEVFLCLLCGFGWIGSRWAPASPRSAAAARRATG
jgi:hypothetical protein